MPDRVSFLALDEEYREVQADVAARFARVLASQASPESRAGL